MDKNSSFTPSTIPSAVRQTADHLPISIRALLAGIVGYGGGGVVFDRVAQPVLGALGNDVDPDAVSRVAKIVKGLTGAAAAGATLIHDVPGNMFDAGKARISLKDFFKTALTGTGNTKFEPENIEKAKEGLLSLYKNPPPVKFSKELLTQYDPYEALRKRLKQGPTLFNQSAQAHVEKTASEEELEYGLEKLASYFDTSYTLPTIPINQSLKVIGNDDFLSRNQRLAVNNIIYGAEDSSVGMTSGKRLAVSAMNAGISFLPSMIFGKVAGGILGLPPKMTNTLSITGGLASAIKSTGIFERL